MLPRENRAPVRRRLDYRPPAFLIDVLTLTFDLAPADTRVTATYGFRRNPAAHALDAAAPLVLDGEQQQDVHVELDGQAVAEDRLSFDPGTLILRDSPASGSLTIHSRGCTFHRAFSARNANRRVSAVSRTFRIAPTSCRATR